MTPREFAERALLGTLMLQPDRVSAVAEWLRPDDFRTPLNAEIYRHIRDLIADNQPDSVTAEVILQRIVTDTEGGAPERIAPYLHTVMATAPLAAQTERYAAMVLEASIRRDVEAAGLRVGQVQATNPELGDLLTAVDAAMSTVEQAQQRWEAISRSSMDRALNRTPGTLGARATESQRRIATTLDLSQPTPSEAEISHAEHTVVGAVLSNPAALAALADRLLPSDFANPQLGNSYRAAVQIHNTSNAGDRVADPVTVAWEQQRQEPAHGPGASVPQLLELSKEASGSYHYAAEVVMRGSLSRLTAHAADTVSAAAQHAGLQPADVLYTGRSAYQVVRATAERMARGQGQDTQRGLDAQTPQWAPRGDGERTVADLAQMRQRSTALLDALDHEPPTAQPAPVFDLASRLDPARDSGPEPT